MESKKHLVMSPTRVRSDSVWAIPYKAICEKNHEFFFFHKIHLNSLRKKNCQYLSFDGFFWVFHHFSNLSGDISNKLISHAVRCVHHCNTNVDSKEKFRFYLELSKKSMVLITLTETAKYSNSIPWSTKHPTTGKYQIHGIQ